MAQMAEKELPLLAHVLDSETMGGKIATLPTANDSASLAHSFLPKNLDADTSAQVSQKKSKTGKEVEQPRGVIHEGDCLKIMREMPDESIKLVVTSPPYNIKNSTGNGLKNGNGGKWPKAALQNGYADHADCLPHEEYVRWQRDCLHEMLRILRPDGAIFYNHKWRVQAGILQDRSDIVYGFPVRQILIWERAGGINFNPGYFLPNYEVIYLIAKPDFKLVSKANALGCVWRIKQESKNPHPAPFPVELAARCIESVGSGPVLDPFMGSGTTAIAAENAGIEWVGIEKSPAYIAMANDRLNRMSGYFT